MDENIHPTLADLTVNTDTLKPYARNPRKGDVDTIAESLHVNGQYRPVVVNRRTSEVLAGNHTLAAALKLGWTRLAATFVDVDDVQAARIVAVDNRANDLAGYDDEQLAALLAELPDLDGTGYSQEDLDELLAACEPDPLPVDGEGDSDPDDIPEPPKDPVTMPGDVWLLGPHRIICGDSRDYDTVAKLLDGARVNVAFTSPPYASQRKYDESSGFRPIPPDEYVDWFADVQANVRAVLADDGSWFVNIKEHAHEGQRDLYVKDLTIAHVRRWAWRLVDEFAWTRPGPPGRWPDRFKNSWEPVFHFAGRSGIKFRPESVSHPSDHIPKRASESGGVQTHHTNGEYWNVSAHTESGMAFPGNVVEVAGVERGTGHVAAFPAALPAWFIRAYSDEADAVFDPFMGSGTTLIAAHQEGRTAYGTEISPGYCDVICRRWQEHTGVKPILEATGEAHDFTAERANT